MKRYIFPTYFLLSIKFESFEHFGCFSLNLDQLYITYAKLLSFTGVFDAFTAIEVKFGPTYAYIFMDIFKNEFVKYQEFNLLVRYR